MRRRKGQRKAKREMPFEASYYDIPRRSTVPSRGQAANGAVAGRSASTLRRPSKTREVFEAYVERLLAPSLKRGRVVVVDNLSAHKGEKVRKLVEDRGCGSGLR